MHILLGLRALHLHVDQTAGLLKRLLQGLRQPLPDPFLYHQTVDENLDIVLDILVQADLLGKFIQVSVDPDAHIAGLSRLGDHLLMLALAAAHDRGKQLQAGLLRERHQRIRHLVNRLPFDLSSALRAMHDPAARVQQTEIIVDLRNGSNRRPWVVIR